MDFRIQARWTHNQIYFRSTDRPNGAMAVILLKKKKPKKPKTLGLPWSQDNISGKQLTKELPFYWELNCGARGGEKSYFEF